MSSKPWFAWFPADYRAKTAHLTFEQDGAYRRLLDAYYERRSPLPAEPGALYRLTSAQDDRERAAIDVVVTEFFTNGDGMLKHARCDEQIAKEKALHKAWSEAGRKGGLSQAQARLEGGSRVGSTIPSPDLDLDLDLQSNPKKPKTKKGPRKTEIVELPDWLPLDNWHTFLEMRSRIRKPATVRAQRMLIGRLYELKDAGHNPGALIAQAELKCWLTFYPPKES